MRFAALGLVSESETNAKRATKSKHNPSKIPISLTRERRHFRGERLAGAEARPPMREQIQTPDLEQQRIGLVLWIVVPVAHRHMGVVSADTVQVVAVAPNAVATACQRNR